jgi:hypothetical protein
MATKLTKKLLAVLPLGNFCYVLNCRTSRVFDYALNNGLENLDIQQSICKKTCKAYRFFMYELGEDFEKET